MSQIAITPGAARKLKNRVSIGQTIHDSLLMGYRGLLKIRRTPTRAPGARASAQLRFRPLVESVTD